MKITSARLFGICFILSFVSYAIGMGLMETVENKTTLIIGALLIAILHTLFNLGLLIVMFNVLKSINKSLSIFYLLLGSFGTLMLTLGAIFLLLPISISETLVQTDQHDSSLFSMILDLSSRGNFYAYQLGMILWGCGGLVFCNLLYKSRLVPVLFPIWGFMGYLIFIVGCGLELFGKPYGVMLSIPGGLFEILLSIWLVTKGFNNGVVITKVNH
ncbi:DUF4386 domain-containing protein [Sphingobacterium haloxyli]|uniref:DUF4386 domain-containing protein n=1 Tax=Sphingobacterium haloxyli TaxID=2100533 RepID=A0A2S9J5J4_9SPHI|nr:DUF4386 domain-containing protein [Sphingobacterium haloxyli]PRD48066.1 hypothetical protein C5745_06005 [Sphingobacterium haloxyli]